MKNNKLEDSLFVTEESMWEKFAFPFVWVWSSVKEKIDIRRYRRQRGKYGYATYDLWDIRDWFVRTLKPMLKEISSNIVSYPPELSQEEWSAILSEMAELLDVFDVWDDTVARCRAGVNLEDNSDNAYLLIKAEQDKVQYIYIVIDDDSKYRSLEKTVPEFCGVFCNSNTFELGMVTQIMRQATFVSMEA